MANESGIDQTESAVENAVEMWCVDTGLDLTEEDKSLWEVMP